ncbi:hypothetical protein CCUN_1092 [Campylobacter cuniculorum DSM 23162 = LMG 24588]|uniref:Uncharacterized protein n=1 Tax=Campylobacter cuniculorum DSM 23162 = LMG 24588 TaxID=1121267 RepID=A0A1W6BX54_9BACT|nr:hypothetical protein CCUN_0446 [Campylobacter cuniculorum DSM 23162 = LMG 24588]ARJ56689.1 hypothetical protein CCUN_1092 [Campylobacter cuniculorum DSM 23162 = LMG 24588]
MRTLKFLYIVWMVFWGFFTIFGVAFGHHGYNDNVILTALYLYLFLCLFPLLPYFYYLIFGKTKSKNILVAICCYLLLFIIMLIADDINIIYFILAIIIHTVTFSIIYWIKRA